MVSKLLKGPELRYHTYERELLALKYTLRKCRYFLDGYPIVAYTDHQSLSMIKKDLANSHNRIIRWVLEIEEYNIQALRYVPGEKNECADALSRYFKDFICPDTTIRVPRSIVVGPELAFATINNITTVDLDLSSTPEFRENTRFTLSPKTFNRWLRSLPRLQVEDPKLHIIAETDKTDRVILSLIHI